MLPGDVYATPIHFLPLTGVRVGDARPSGVVPHRREHIETGRAVAALRFKLPCLFYLHRHMHTGLLHFQTTVSFD